MLAFAKYIVFRQKSASKHLCLEVLPILIYNFLVASQLGLKIKYLPINHFSTNPDLYLFHHPFFLLQYVPQK